MKSCELCNIIVKNDTDICPLCGEELVGNNINSDNEYPKIVIDQKRTLLVKLVSFMSILIISGLFLLNLMTENQLKWSLIMTTIVLYLWISVYFTVKHYRNLGFMIIKQVLSISILSFLIDYFTGYHKWSTNYVIPFAIIISTMMITVLIMIKPLKFREYFIYQVSITTLGIMSVLMIVFNLTSIRWTSVLAAFYSAMTLIGMFIFADGKSSLELKKRFHI